MANQGKSQSGTAGSSSDERKQGNQDRNREQSGPQSGNKDQSSNQGGTKPGGTQGGMNKGAGSNQADGNVSDDMPGERRRRESDAD
jgi:hypothetical protein